MIMNKIRKVVIINDDQHHVDVVIGENSSWVFTGAGAFNKSTMKHCWRDWTYSEDRELINRVILKGASNGI